MAAKRPRQNRAVPARPVEAAVRAREWAKRARLWRMRALFVSLIVLAVALRVANLTTQSLWADEGNSVRLSERSLDLVIAAARADIHPPGYYLLLWGWVRLFGRGEATVRSLSVVVGLALVGLIYLMGRRWFGPPVGWLAAFCAAVSPFQVVYSQEVRMYILVAFLGAGATCAFARWIERGERRQRLVWSAVYIVAAAAGLWTHYSFPVVIAALNVAWLVWWMRTDPTQGVHNIQGRWRSSAWRKMGLWWLSMHLVIAILYLPWLPTAWSKIWGYGAISESHPIAFIVAQSFRLLSTGETVPDDDLTRWLTVGTVTLSALGAWGGLAPGKAPQKRLSSVYTLALILLILVPIVMMVALTLTGRPAYRPKFFLVASPAFCVLAGEGIALLGKALEQRRTVSSQLWLLLGMGLIGVGAARSLRNYYSDAAYARADYRGIAAFISDVERAGDAILLNAPNQWEVFTYYYRGHSPVYPLCRSRPPREEEVTAELEQIVAQHRRLFALYWAAEESDPERIVERWLEARAFKASDVWYRDLRLVTYAVQEGLAPADAFRPAHPLEDVRLGAAIALRGYTLASSQVQRGDILQVTLFWEALDAPSGRYKVFLHLVDSGGQLVSQVDSEPGDGMNLTMNWRPERGVFADRYGLLVPRVSQAGEYPLLVGMYDVSGAPRLPITISGELAADALILATIEIR